MEKDEQIQMQKEIEAILEKYGVQDSDLTIGNLSDEENLKVRNIAAGIVQGNIDLKEFSDLNENLKESVGSYIKHLIEIRAKTGIREIEEKNPYYSAFTSRIIRDNADKEGQ